MESPALVCGTEIGWKPIGEYSYKAPKGLTLAYNILLQRITYNHIIVLDQYIASDGRVRSYNLFQWLGLNMKFSLCSHLGKFVAHT